MPLRRPRSRTALPRGNSDRMSRSAICRHRHSPYRCSLSRRRRRPGSIARATTSTSCAPAPAVHATTQLARWQSGASEQQTSGVCSAAAEHTPRQASHVGRRAPTPARDVDIYVFASLTDMILKVSSVQCCNCCRHSYPHQLRPRCCSPHGCECDSPLPRRRGTA